MVIDFEKRFLEMQNKRKAKNTAARTKILAELREYDVKKVCAKYFGYGDEGNIQFNVEPEMRLLPTLASNLEDFLWDVAYNEHPGFEINEGAEGKIVWDIAKNSINLDHTANVLSTVNTVMEDI